MHPRIFLTHHFWSTYQKFEFQQIYLKNRLTYNVKVFRNLQAKLDGLEKHVKYDEMKRILGLLGSGLHPSADEIINVKEIFTEKPYSLDSLTSKHVVSIFDSII